MKSLVEEIGLDQGDAERRLLDSDLWMLPPETLLGLGPEEAVEMWTGAIDDLDRAAELFGSYNPATAQAILEGRERAAEARRRAKRG